jgi:hypothetical protein
LHKYQRAQQRYKKGKLTPISGSSHQRSLTILADPGHSSGAFRVQSRSKEYYRGLYIWNLPELTPFALLTSSTPFFKRMSLGVAALHYLSQLDGIRVASSRENPRTMDTQDKQFFSPLCRVFDLKKKPTFTLLKSTIDPGYHF